MAKAVGIDLGTTYSLVAVTRGRRIRVLNTFDATLGDATIDGQKIASDVAFVQDNGLVRYVGARASRLLAIEPKCGVDSSKRFMGTGITFEIFGETFSPAQIAAAILSQLKEDASRALDEEVTDAVITVPANFNDAQRSDTCDAAKIAGLNVLRIINEPTAAALAYGLQQAENQIVGILDLGGGTFDVTLARVAKGGHFEVLASQGDDHLGGDDWDAILTQMIAADFQSRHGVDLLQFPGKAYLIRQGAMLAKHAFSTSAVAHIDIPGIAATRQGALSIIMDIEQADFVAATEHLIDRCVEPIHRALDECKLTRDNIHQVVLVGGSSRLESFRRMVPEQFPKSRIVNDLDPDKVVVMGAAVQASLLTERAFKMTVSEITNHTIGLRTVRGLHPVIRRGQRLPAMATVQVTPAKTGDDSTDIIVVQESVSTIEADKQLGRFTLTGLVGERPAVTVTFDVDEDGILKVTAEQKGVAKHSITVTNASRRSSAELELLRRAEVALRGGSK